jgi:hypothetical protein
MNCILDLKSNKVEPWVAIQTGAYTLLDGPVEYDGGRHIYRDELGFNLPSVTQILSSEGFINTQWYTEHGRDRGAMLHLACHYDDISDLDEQSIDPQIKPFLDAYRRFKTESGFTVQQSEIPMCNLKYKFAGTPDKIGSFPHGKIDRAAVELHNDGSYRLIPFKARNDVNIWLAILAVYNWKQNNMRRK